jgi:L-rhamnose 1-dehydrogenase
MGEQRHKRTMMISDTRFLAGKTLLDTGGSRGIGRAVAVSAARHGANVALNYWSKSGAGYGPTAAHDEVVAEIAASGGKAIAIEGDVADPSAAAAMVAATVAAFGRLDVFVSNAGICPMHAFLDLPSDMFARTLEVNLHGAFYTTQAAARQMRDQGDGDAIVAMSSISALVGGEFQTHYTPTKAGVLSLMQSCATALGRYGIRCNSVLPGEIRTDLNAEDLAQPDKAAYFNKRIPLGRLGEPDDVAGCVVFLASDLARYVTGAALLVDGGMFVNLQ